MLRMQDFGCQRRPSHSLACSPVCCCCWRRVSCELCWCRSFACSESLLRCARCELSKCLRVHLLRKGCSGQGWHLVLLLLLLLKRLRLEMVNGGEEGREVAWGE